jgi:predicted small metal-binding protein
MARAWRCLEAGCDAIVVADDDQQLVAAVNRHVAEAHDSFELEEVILDAAQDAGGLQGLEGLASA